MHSRYSTFAGLLAACLVCGCATEAPPDFDEIRQQTGTLANLSPERQWAAGGGAGQVADNWLATFDDEQLNALVAEAMANNTDLRVTATRVEQAAQHVEMARSKLRPAVNLLGTGGVNASGGDIGSALQGIMLAASWEIDLWGRLRYGRNAAEATQASVQADFEFARQSLAATIAKAWFTATETWLQIQISDEMVVAAGELVTLAEKRASVGVGNEQDVALARANLGGIQDGARQVRLAHDQTIRALELLIGRYPSAELQSRPELVVLPGPVPAGLPLEMLERRPDMVAAERRIAAAFNRVGEAKTAQLPQISLHASVAGLQSEILELQDDFENPAAGLGGRLLAPIYQGGALKAQAEIRTIEQKEAVADYARMALRALGDVENALAASETLVDRETTLTRVESDHTRALDLTLHSYKVGRADLRSVQQQQMNVYSARLGLLRVRSEQLSQRANLHLALGGSFEEPPPPPEETEAAAATVAQRQ